MYILKNSLISIIRNKGRNFLIGIIILVIACSSTVTLAIRNTADTIVKNYENSTDLIATISFNRESLMQNFQGGEDAVKSNIEAFNNVEQITLDEVKNYGDSQYLNGYYYTYTTSLNSDTLSKATDTYEYEVENSETSTETSTDSSTTTSTSGGSSEQTSSSQGHDGMPGGMSSGDNIQVQEKNTVINNNTNTTTVITRSKEKFESNKNMTGDFTLSGYSSYDAMTNFVDGTYKISDGEMISDFSGYECVISEELAKLNNVSVGSEIVLKNPNTEATYTFKVTGIYTDKTDDNNSQSMYSSSANTIITGSGIVETIASEDSSLVTDITPSFILKSKDDIELFTNELTEKGLSSYYTVNTNLDDIENATESIQNVKTFATTFLLITLAIAAVVLFVINMINIRERKYEIGVFRTIGVSKLKLTLQFMLELIIVSFIFLIIGAGIGAGISKPIGNMLLSNEIESSSEESEQMSNNFGKSEKMDMQFNNNMVKTNQIDSMEAVVNFKVILELLGIGLVLTIISGIASMISIQRFSPLTILKERS